VSLQDRIPKSHPLRKIRVIVDRAHEDADAIFDDLHSQEGRPSNPPERLLRALSQISTKRLLALARFRGSSVLWMPAAHRCADGLAME
jgi:hypothetical protein